MTPNRAPDEPSVSAVAGSPRGPSAGLVAIAVIVAVAGAIGIAAFSSPSPGPLSTTASVAPSAVAATSPAATIASPAPTGIPTPTATVVVMRGVLDPPAEIGALLGCKRIAASIGQFEPVVAGADVDAAIQAAGRDSGWLYVPAGSPTPQRVWLGEDVVTLAQAAGVSLVTVGTDGTVWLGGASGLTRWAPWTTPAGRTAWLMTADEVTGAGACDRPMATVFSYGMRSLSCASVGMPDCLSIATRAWFTPASAATELDVVVAQRPCPSGERCAPAPPVVAAVRAGGSGLGDVRWAVSVAPVAGVATRTLVPADLPAFALDAIGRPSLPLPTARETGRVTDCTESISGGLRGSPWDPRVAWIGTMAVSWPAGSAARFDPDLALIVRGAQVLRAGAPVVATGSVGDGGRTFVACSVTPAGGPGVSPAPAP